LALVGGPLDATAPVAAADGAVLTITGRGNGHGIGMSQWGAYGYAADHGWTAAQILDRYYGGTVAGTTDATSITVRLMNLDDQQTAVVHDKGALVVDGVAGGPWRSVVARETGDRSYTVWARTDAAVCPSGSDPLAGWTVVAGGLPSVTIRPQTDTSATSDPAELAAACEPSGKVRSYRGVLRAVNGTAGENRTVNEVPLEQYLRAIVATEMSASWAPKGSAALQAQAIAARSFGLAENRYSYAKTCDLICQAYPGAAYRSAVGAAYTRVEQASVDVNVQATAGQVRRVGSTSGPIALTMFSSSSGGWTAASTLPFPAVEDEGDDTAGNPYHRWTVTVPVATVEAAWPAIGSYTGVTVTSRSGQGEWGGRVLSITVSGTAGSVSLTGDTFRRAIGLRSNWFDLGGVGAPAAPAAGGTTPTGCSGRDEPPITGAAADAPAARFSPMVPVRLIDTRDGTGTAAVPLGLGCTLQVHPQVAPGTTSVAVNIVTVDPGAQGFITAYPCGLPRTFTSAVQSQPGRIVSGSVIVPLGVDGSFCVFSNVATDVVIDMTGSFSPDAADRFEPIVAQRRFDSRPGGVPLEVGQVVRVPTRGAGGAGDDSTGASITIHALDASVAGWIVAWPCDSPRPWASSANVNAGESVTNHVDVATGPTGEVCLMTSARMHLAVDVNGWYGPSATTDFHSVVPVRVADTRDGQAWSGQFARNVTRRITIASAGGLPGPGVVRAVAVQLTAVSGSSSGWVTVHPCLPTTPDVSMLRFPARTNVAVLSTDIVSASGEWCVVASNATHLVVDVSGWFG
jgi:SpoIID/LytB domain protein